jgi:hypothetical protein
MLCRLNRIVFLLLLLVAGSAVVGRAQATPATLHFGPGANTGLLCPGGSSDVALGCGLHPNPTPLNHLDVFQTSGGAESIDNFYLLIGIPVPSGGAMPSAPSITRVDTYNPYAPTKDPSPSVNTSGWSPSFCGWFTAGESNPYAECGLSTPNSSNSFTNWYAAAAALGLNPAQFAVFQYHLSGLEPLGPKGLYDVFFGGPLPVGTMEIAYGCSTGSSGATCYVTPMTEAGQVVPEPSTWFMMAGAALIFLGRLRRFRRS